MALPHYGTPINTDYEPLYKNLFEVLFTTVDNLDSMLRICYISYWIRKFFKLFNY